MADKNTRIGGNSLAEEAIAGAAMSGISAIFHAVEHKEAAQLMLRNLPPVVDMLLSPAILNTAFAALPDFGHPEVAQALKHIIVHSAGEVVDMAHDAKYASGMTDAGYEEALTRGAKKLGEMKFAAMGRFVHELDCTELPVQRPQAKPQKGKDPLPQQPQGYREIGLQRAAQMKLFGCPICMGCGTKTVQASGGAAPTERKPEPLEIIALLTEDRHKTAFSDLLAMDSKRVFKALHHLSSKNEAVGMCETFIALKTVDERTAFIDNLETLLQLDDTSRAQTKDFFGSIGGIIEGGGSIATEVIDAFWNAKSEPVKPATQTDDESDYLPRRWVLGFIPLPRKRRPGSRIGIVDSFML